LKKFWRGIFWRVALVVWGAFGMPEIVAGVLRGLALRAAGRSGIEEGVKSRGRWKVAPADGTAWAVVGLCEAWGEGAWSFSERGHELDQLDHD
jgi:hypothetical protein